MSDPTPKPENQVPSAAVPTWFVWVAIGGAILFFVVKAATGNSDSAAKPGANTSLSLASSRPELFDPSIPAAQREATAQSLVVGNVNGMTSFGPINYTFDSGGTWSSTLCVPYGEVSVRKFKPHGAGRWSVHEQRYQDTGKIFYGVSLTGEDGISVVGLILDRDNGLLINNGGDGVRPANSGFTSDCGS